MTKKHDQLDAEVQKMGLRLGEILRLKEIRQSHFAADVGMSQAYMNQMCRGKRLLSINTVVQILGIFPEVNPRWLLLGEGEMYSKEVNTIAKSNNSIDAVMSRLESLEKEMNDLKNQK